MEIKEAQKIVDEKIKEYGGYWTELSMLARVTEEVGELARAMNIKYGQKKSKFEGDGGNIKDELADVFFTLFAIANVMNIDVEKELNSKIKKSHQRYKEVYNK